MKITYDVWALGCDDDYNVLDDDHCFGVFDTREEAWERFNEITESDKFKLTSAPHTRFVIEITENEDNFSYSECVDTIAECVM